MDKPRLTPAQRRHLEWLRDERQGRPEGWPAGRCSGRVMHTLHQYGLVEHQPVPNKPNLVTTVISQRGREWFE